MPASAFLPSALDAEDHGTTTLRKIDAIEAQMAQQWLRTADGSAPVTERRASGCRRPRCGVQPGTGPAARHDGGPVAGDSHAGRESRVPPCRSAPRTVRALPSRPISKKPPSCLPMAI
jgi:hypothetical protein